MRPRPPEPEKLNIVFEKRAEPFKMKKGWHWERLLEPVRNSPGCEARVREYRTEATARTEVTRIKNRLRFAVPYEKWRIRVGKVVWDDEAMYGMYCTYFGVMTEQEYQLARAQFLKRSNQQKKIAEKRRLMKQLQGEDLDLTQIIQLRQPGR